MELADEASVVRELIKAFEENVGDASIGSAIAFYTEVILIFGKKGVDAECCTGISSAFDTALYELAESNDFADCLSHDED